MILAIDMGNTNIKIGMISDREGSSIREERLMTDRNKTSMEYALIAVRLRKSFMKSMN